MTGSGFDDALAALGQCRDTAGFVVAAHRVREVAVDPGWSRAADVATVSERWSAFARVAVATAAGLVGEADLAAAGWQWYVSGSSGRGEALPGADIETLTVVTGDRGAALAAAADVHALLDSVGVRADANGATASRSRFARTSAAWTRGIDRWLAAPAVDRGVVMTGLLADATPVPRAAAGLRTELLDALSQHHAPVLTAMLDDALVTRETVPSRLRVVAGGRDSVDLKRAILDPIAKLARWAALSSGSSAMLTVDRLSAGAGVLSTDHATSLAECWTFATSLRWAARAAAVDDGGMIRDDVALSDLAPQVRAQLRGVGREVAGIMRVLNYARPDRGVRP